MSTTPRPSPARAPLWPPSRRAGALAGIAVPAVFWTGVVLATWAGWDFLHANGWSLTNHADSVIPWPSGTALADSGWIMNATFALSGLLLFVFARTFRRELVRPVAGRVAGALITVSAIALGASALNTDLGGNQPDTWHGWVHLVAFFVVMLSALMGLIATAVALRGDPRWHGFSRAAVAVAVLIVASLGIPNDVGFYVVVLVLFGWFGALGLRMHSIARQHNADPAYHPRDASSGALTV